VLHISASHQASRSDCAGFEIGAPFRLFDLSRILAYALSFVFLVLAIEMFRVHPVD
jgi:NitT/TauT family transport system permease protein